MEWVKCDVENLPPTGVEMLLLLPEITTEKGTFPSIIAHSYGHWDFVGVPGVDFTHYLILEYPEGIIHDRQ
jgi:hypothetical protein